MSLDLVYHLDKVAHGEMLLILKIAVSLLSLPNLVGVLLFLQNYFQILVC